MVRRQIARKSLQALMLPEARPAGTGGIPVANLVTTPVLYLRLAIAFSSFTR
jgi:hypothetical protein